MVSHLEAHDYDGWYVLEQGAILAEEPLEEDPVADVFTRGYDLRMNKLSA